MKRFLVPIFFVLALGLGALLPLSISPSAAQVYSRFARYLQPLAADPATGTEGQIYQNTTSHVAKVYNGSAWTALGGFTGGAVGSAINLPNGSTATPSLTGATTNAGFSFNTTSARYSSGGNDNGLLLSDSVALGSAGCYTFSSTTSPAGASDLKACRDSAGVLRLDNSGTADGSLKAASVTLGTSGNLFGGTNTVRHANGTSSQTLEVYKTTDSNSSPVNYERLRITPTSIGTQQGGTGSNQNLTLSSGFGGSLLIGSTFQFNANVTSTTDNGADLGVSGNDFRNVRAKTSFKLANATGGTLNLLYVTTTVNAAAGATISASNLIPAGSLVVGVTTRVTTAFGTTNGLTSISVGDGTTANLFSNNTGITLATTTEFTNHLSTFAPKLYTSATSIVVTGNGGSGFDATGQIRVTVYYYSLTPSTS
jgi:hypothetical protein